MNVLIWFRNDLRSHDNTALHHAARYAREHRLALRALYVATPQQWREHGTSPRQHYLLYTALTHLQRTLAERGIALDVEVVDGFRDVPAFLKGYCETNRVQAVFANREYLLNEMQRDRKVAAALPCKSHWYHDRLLIEPGAVLNGSGDPYKVFTPFAKTWRRVLAERDVRPLRRPSALGAACALSKIPVFCEPADIPHWLRDEDSALKQLRYFCRERVQDYARQRDFPAKTGTSQLSAALAIGLLSPRQCLARLRSESERETTSRGETTWLNELIWREFYQHVAYHFPRVVKGRAFKPETERIIWRDAEEDFKAWCEGKTGFPIVDAGMRQLRQTGWMHNRLRMITSSFLVKDLHIDWRRGERYFMSQLIDGEFAANNGGWQWAASTGTDAAPYFRVFNPTTQGKRFDPEGHFIRQYLPELSGLDKKAIHEPPATPGYPAPIVDHRWARERAIAMFKAVQ